MLVNTSAAADGGDEWEQPPCAGQGDLFFSAELSDHAAAKAICQGCGQKVRCARVAIEVGAVDGIWAGMTIDELNRGLSDADRRRARSVGHPSATNRAAVSPVHRGADDVNGTGPELSGEAVADPGA
jgi:hypothetical protein